MSILYIITKATWGGAQAHLYDLIKDRVEKNDEVYLVVGEEGELTQRLRKLDGVSIKIDKMLVRELSPIKDFLSILGNRAYIKKIKPTIIHLHSSKAGAVGRIAAIGLDSKVIFTAHGWAFTEGVRKIKRNVYITVEKLLAKITDQIICVSEYDYNLARKVNVITDSTNAVTIKNGVEKYDIEDKLINNEVPVITMTARFAVPKNQKLLIEALSKIAEPFQVNLIGDGETLNQCKDFVESLGMTNKINFLGFQRDVANLLKKTDIFTLISDYEGLPISIIEAMSCSVPVIASNVGGIPELIDDGVSGYCVDNNPADITKAFEELLKNGELRNRMGKSAYKKYMSNFQIEKNLEEVSHVYEILSEERYAKR